MNTETFKEMVTKIWNELPNTRKETFTKTSFVNWVCTPVAYHQDNRFIEQMRKRDKEIAALTDWTLPN